MQIVDLTREHEDLYFKCLEDWSGEIKEAGHHKEDWYRKMVSKGLRVKLAQDDNGTIGGMIQYLPIETWFEDSKDFNIILCIWVHGYEEGRGNFQGRGMGTGLLRAAEEDSRSQGKKGIVAWGVSLPFWMRASWFKKQGYRKIDRQGIQVLLWKPFVEDAVAPRWPVEKRKPRKKPGQVTVSAFIRGWCPAQNTVFERAKRAAAELGDRVAFEAYPTSEKEVFLEWGISDGLFIDGKRVNTGPPPSYEKITGLVEKRLRKLKR
jgi:hypothetical protein